MAKRTSILLIIGTGLFGIVIGYFIAQYRSNVRNSEMFNVGKYYDVEHKVKVLECLYGNNSEAAIKEVEKSLNIDILTLCPNPDTRESLDDWSRAALRLAHKHRVSHPFSVQSPGINKMVQEALQSAQ